jgi:hypothetical protein
MGAPAADGSVGVTLSSYSATCVPQVWYRLDGALKVGPASSPVSFVISTPGTHVVEYWANDYSGNVEAAKTVNVVVKTSQPVDTVTSTIDVVSPNPALLGATVSFSTHSATL